MEQPFIDIQIQPSYGKNTCVVFWRVKPEYTNGNFFVYRSYDGKRNWVLLNEEPVNGRSFFEDTNFVVDNRVDSVFYRILLERGESEEYDSPVKGLFDDMTRAEYGGVHAMMKQEYLSMSRGNGVKALYLIPKDNGAIASGVDVDTFQEPVFPSAIDASQGFSTEYAGGFACAFSTWVSLSDLNSQTMGREDGLGLDDKVSVAARLLAFPSPGFNHLIITPSNDNRYVIGESTKTFYFKGIYPIAHTVTLQLLKRNDPRYKIDISEITNSSIFRDLGGKGF